MVPNGFISEAEIADELGAKKIYLQGLSRNRGRPVMLIKARNHFPSKDQLQFKKFVVYLLDKTIARCFKSSFKSSKDMFRNLALHLPFCSFKGREIGDEKLIAVLDLQSISYKNVDARGLITGFQFLQAYYPERLAKLYILSMPWFFVGVWRMVSRFLEKATLEKVVIVSNEDEKRDFMEEIGEEVLPEEYGGRAKLIPIQDVVLSPLDG
ncbi:phosphatidylinositol transfer protein CSR1 [Punica granatum]|nr:phosphatidylinositol transfer protein CSR1 [Punica granatum]XP_031389146.1 phosphatidylinositol transfer protein CSR1 [Punica granatum]